LRGRFISLEGGEGAGKSTQARMLADRLQARGIDVLLTREPGGAPGAEEIRSLLVTGAVERWSPMAETLLHMAARAEHLAHAVLPALEFGRWVVSDRFVDSTVVYQGILQGVGEDRVRALHRLALDDVMPDATAILDMPADEGLRRSNGRSEAAASQAPAREDRYERMGGDFHRRIADSFRTIAAQAPERCVLIDAAGAPDEVHARLWSALANRLPELAQ